MFDDADTKPVPQTKAKRSAVLTYLLGGLVVILVCMAAILIFKIQTAPAYTVPANIVEETPHTIFVPKKLPDGYKVVEGSFTTGEGAALIFRAEDISGSSIVFTEQKRPENFDFDQFYKQQMGNAKKLSGTPYPSFLGKSPAGDILLLSVVTDDTWIIASTPATLGEQDFTTIAKGLKPY